MHEQGKQKGKRALVLTLAFAFLTPNIWAEGIIKKENKGAAPPKPSISETSKKIPKRDKRNETEFLKVVKDAFKHTQKEYHILRNLFNQFKVGGKLKIELDTSRHAAGLPPRTPEEVLAERKGDCNEIVGAMNKALEIAKRFYRFSFTSVVVHAYKTRPGKLITGHTCLALMDFPSKGKTTIIDPTKGIWGVEGCYQWIVIGNNENAKKAYFLFDAVGSYLENGKIKEARKAINEALKLDKNPLLYLQLGYVCLWEGNYKAAINAFKQASKMKEDWEEPFYGIGRAYLEMGEKQKARDYFVKALLINKHHQEAREQLKKLLESMGKEKCIIPK